MADFIWDFPYTSRRMPVLAANVVATSQPLAAQAGLQMLYKGGNAVDAALAAAIALALVRPAKARAPTTGAMRSRRERKRRVDAENPPPRIRTRRK